MNHRKPTRIAALALCAVALGAGGAFAQGPEDGGSGGQGGNQPPPPPPLPPVIQALDTNHDCVIGADEIANASESLKTLLKSGSTSLAIPDLLGPPRHGRRPPGQGGQGPQTGQNQQAGQGPQGEQGPQGGPGTSGTSGNNPGGPHRHRPLPPVIQALDTNKDGIIDSDEIANAPQSLRTLLKNGSSQLTIPDLLGPPPPRPPRGGGQNSNQNGPPGQGGQGGGGADGNPPPDGQGPPPPPPSQSGSNGQSNYQQPPPPPE